MEKYSDETDRVQVDIAPLEDGCELTLTHRMGGAWAEYAPRVTAGWATILQGLAAGVEPPVPTGEASAPEVG